MEAGPTLIIVLLLSSLLLLCVCVCWLYMWVGAEVVSYVHSISGWFLICGCCC